MGLSPNQFQAVSARGGLYSSEGMEALRNEKAFWVLVTGYDGGRFYSWTEVTTSNFTTEPGFNVTDGGGSGTFTSNPLWEANGKFIPSGTRVLARLSYFSPTFDWTYVTEYDSDAIEIGNPNTTPTSNEPPGTIIFIPGTNTLDGKLWLSIGTNLWVAFCPCTSLNLGSGSGSGSSSGVVVSCCAGVTIPMSLTATISGTISCNGSYNLVYGGGGVWNYNPTNPPLGTCPASPPPLVLSCAGGIWGLIQGNAPCVLLGVTCDPFYLTFQGNGQCCGGTGFIVITLS